MLKRNNLTERSSQIPKLNMCVHTLSDLCVCVIAWVYETFNGTNGNGTTKYFDMFVHMSLFEMSLVRFFFGDELVQIFK